MMKSSADATPDRDRDVGPDSGQDMGPDLGEAPLLSVVVPTYGRPDRLLELVDRLMAQEADDFTFEVIVVDDGSPDPVGPALRARFPSPRIPLRVLRTENGGPAHARNHGAGRAKGAYLLFVDDDMLVPPNFVRGHVEIHRDVGPCVANNDFEWEIRADPPPFQAWYERREAEWTAARRDGLRPVADGLFEVESAVVTTAGLSVGRADFEQFGGFDVGYPFGCEDQDFGFRLHASGMPVYLTRRTGALHVETHNTLRRVCRRQEKGAADTVRFVRRFGLSEAPEDFAMSDTCGPIRPRRDSWSLVGKKLIRRAIVAPTLAPAVFALVALMERTAPGSPWLQRAYDLIVGAYVQAGWRHGLEKYRGTPRMESLIVAGQR